MGCHLDLDLIGKVQSIYNDGDISEKMENWQCIGLALDLSTFLLATHPAIMIQYAIASN